jgi:effector-binding domain-containing protein
MPTVGLTLRTVDPRPTAVVAQTTTWPEYPSLWPRLLDEVYAFVRGRPELATGSDSDERWRNVMLYLDRRPSVEVGVLASGPFPALGRVVASALPGGTVATAVHRGDYADLGQTHDAIHEFIEGRGLAPAGPLWEIYGHHREDPRERETEVYWLVR